MLVHIGGREQVKYPPIPEDKYEGSFKVNSYGYMERLREALLRKVRGKET